MGFDGAPLTNSGKRQVWPIMVGFLNVESIMNDAFVATLCSEEKVSCPSVLFKDFIPELNELQKKGLFIDGKHISIKMKKYCMDGPAKAAVLGIKNTNGYSSSTKCTVRGEKDGGRVYFDDLFCGERSHDDIMDGTDSEFQKRANAISSIDGINLQEDIPVEYMHLVGQGVMKKLLCEHWMKVKDRNKSCKLSGLMINKINQTLENLRDNKFFPREFARYPRTLEFVNMWKATEMRAFLLYIGPVVMTVFLEENEAEKITEVKKKASKKQMNIKCDSHNPKGTKKNSGKTRRKRCKGIYEYISDEDETVDPRNKRYADGYKNFLRLHIACTILLSEILRKDSNIDYAEQQLRKFVNEYAQIYGIEFVSHNVHGLIHLAQDAKFGSLHKVSAFRFENLLRLLIQLIRKPSDAVLQVVRRIHEMNACGYEAPTEDSDENAVRYSLKHHDGPLIGNMTDPQYRLCQSKFITLSLRRFGDRCFLTKSNEIVLACNFATGTDGTVKIIGRRFCKKGNFYLEPVPSSQLGIWEVSSLSVEFSVWDLKQIALKYVILPKKVNSEASFTVFIAQN